MGIDPPYLYDHPSKYSFNFQPKAVSEASWRPSPQRPKQEGPLINAKEFNKHPDSYYVP